MFEYMTVRELYELTLGSGELEKDNLDYIELQGGLELIEITVL